MNKHERSGCGAAVEEVEAEMENPEHLHADELVDNLSGAAEALSDGVEVSDNVDKDWGLLLSRLRENIPPSVRTLLLSCALMAPAAQAEGAPPRPDSAEVRVALSIDDIAQDKETKKLLKAFEKKHGEGALASLVQSWLSIGSLNASGGYSVFADVSPGGRIGGTTIERVSVVVKQGNQYVLMIRTGASGPENAMSRMAKGKVLEIDDATQMSAYEGMESPTAYVEALLRKFAESKGLQGNISVNVQPKGRIAGSTVFRVTCSDTAGKSTSFQFARGGNTQAVIESGISGRLRNALGLSGNRR